MKNLGFYLFLAALALAPLLGGTPTGYEYALSAWGGDAMGGIIRALVLAAALLTAITGEPVVVKQTPAATVARLGIFGAAAWVAVSLLVHSAFFTSQVYLFAMLPDALNWLTFAVSFALAARFAAQNPVNTSRIAIALLTGGVVCAVVGVLAFGAVPGVERAAHREAATFFSPNFAGGFAALLLPVAVASFLLAEGLIALVLSGATVALVFALLLLTGSRASLGLAIAGLALALALALLRKVAVSWQRIGVAVAILLVAGFMFRAPMLGRVGGVAPPAPASGGADDSGASVSPALAGAGGATTTDHSGAFRQETWHGTLAMATANPVFGTAPGTFPYTYPRYARVAWTGHAHSSFLQLAGESGFPALALVTLGIGGAVFAGVAGGKSAPLLGYALVGGIVAAIGRNGFDSEWILPASGVAFFTVLGTIVGAAHPSVPDETVSNPPDSVRITSGLFFAATLILCLMLRAGQSERDLLIARSRGDANVAAQAKEAASRILPADPQLHALASEYETAAFLSPSGKRFFQLARAFERRGDTESAVGAYKQSVAADPNNQQTKKALAEAQTVLGDDAGALFTYLDMVKTAESPAGTVRALPELVDTLPAFAYVALAEDAKGRGDIAEAQKNFQTARQIVDDYSRTAPAYQIAEVATLGANVAPRRAEVRDLYTARIVPGCQAVGIAVSPADAAATVSRLDAFATGAP